MAEKHTYVTYVTYVCKLILSSNLFQFGMTQTQFIHRFGEMVNYQNKLLAIGGYTDTIENSNGILIELPDSELNSNAEVEELQGEHWTRSSMSPVNYLYELYHFSTVSMGSNLYIFGICRNLFNG